MPSGASDRSGIPLSSLPTPALLFAADGGCLDASPAARRLLGIGDGALPAAADLFVDGAWWTAGAGADAAPARVVRLAPGGGPRLLEAAVGPADAAGRVVVALRAIAPRGPRDGVADPTAGDWVAVEGIAAGFGESPAGLLPLLTALAPSADALVVVDNEGRHRYVNPAHRDLLGWEPADVLGQPFVALLHPDDAGAPQADRARFGPARAGRLGAVARVRRPDGDWRWVESLVVDRREDPERAMVFVSRDVTERVVLERATAAVAATARAIAAGRADAEIDRALLAAVCAEVGSPFGELWRPRAGGDGLDRVAVWHADAPPFAAPAGSPEEPSGRLGEGLPGGAWATGSATWEDDAGAAAGLGAAVAAPVTVAGNPAGVLVAVFRHPGGREGWLVEVVASALRQIDPLLAARQATNALRAGEERFRAFADHSPAAVFIKDGAGRYRFVNPVAAATAGLSPAEMVGRRDAELFPAETAAALRAADLRALAGDTVEVLERAATADGERAFLSIKFPLTNADGERFVGAVAVDVTARERLEREVAERAERERALREREERFRAMIEQGGDLVVFADASGTVRHASAAAGRVVGREPATLVGASVTALFRPEDGPRVRRAIERARDRDRTVRFEARPARPDGRATWVEVLASAAAGPDAGIVLAARDITARRALDAQLRESEELFRAAFAETSVGMAVVALDGRPRRVNQAVCRLLGYAPEDLLARRFEDVTHPDDVPADLAQGQRLLAGEVAAFEREKRFLRKDGAVVWALVNATLARGADGAPHALIAQIQDITDRKRAEERLAFQADLLDRAWDAILAWEWDGPVVFWNRGAERLYGYAPEEAIGRRSHDLLDTRHPAGLAAVLAALDRDGVWEGELAHRCANGRPITVASRLALVRAGGRRVVLEINRDVTDRRRAEDEVRSALAHAEEANRLKTAFLLTVSHELRTPLNSIIGYAHLLLDGFSGELSAQQHDDVRQIARSADHLLALIEDLLDLSKVEAGRTDLELEEIDPAAVLGRVRALLAPDAAAKGIAVRVEVDPGLPPLRADPQRLLQMVLNLAANAVKFTEHGQVTLRASAAAGGRVLISVADTGIGIQEAELGRVFEPFHQADLGAARRFGGIGLGLSIARALAEAHGGSIAAESEPGRGSVFRIELPLAGPRGEPEA